MWGGVKATKFIGDLEGNCSGSAGSIDFANVKNFKGYKFLTSVPFPSGENIKTVVLHTSNTSSTKLDKKYIIEMICDDSQYTYCVWFLRGINVGAPGTYYLPSAVYRLFVLNNAGDNDIFWDSTQFNGLTTSNALFTTTSNYISSSGTYQYILRINQSVLSGASDFNI